jgi:hypothetical protein
MENDRAALGECEAESLLLRTKTKSDGEDLFRELSMPLTRLDEDRIT